MNTTTRYLFAGLLLCCFFLPGCVHQQPQVGVSQYRFNYDGDEYRIRSISANHVDQPRNELIGRRLVATDLDQDRVLDQIVLGDMSLFRAQQVYDFGIAMASRENKLSVSSQGINQYRYVSDNFFFEIRSFHPANAAPFNEFIVVDNRRVISQVTILVDQDADGILDEVLVGSQPLGTAQSQYAETIQAGLQCNELIVVDHRILVNK